MCVCVCVGGGGGFLKQLESLRNSVSIDYSFGFRKIHCNYIDSRFSTVWADQHEGDGDSAGSHPFLVVARSNFSLIASQNILSDQTSLFCVYKSVILVYYNDRSLWFPLSFHFVFLFLYNVVRICWKFGAYVWRKSI